MNLVFRGLVLYKMANAVKQEKITKLALIAGRGELPHHLAASATKSGIDVSVIALNKNTYNQFKDSYQSEYYSPVEVLEIIDSIKSQEIKHMVFIGKVPKLDFFKNIHKLDPSLMKIVQGLGDMNDDSLHFSLLRLLEEEHGLTVIDQTQYLRDFFPGPQVFSERQPDAGELSEIQYGLKMAKAIAAVDIGQTVVVKNKAVIAVEAIEGTNHCIKRAANSFAWFKDNRITVCKVSKPNQDNRFDVPTVGLKTIAAMPANSILAFEANECFFVDQAKSIKLANQKNILLCSVSMGIS